MNQYFSKLTFCPHGVVACRTCGRQLRQEIQACHRIKEHEYERQLDHYVLIQNSIDEADKENLGDLFLDLDGIEEITQAFSSREKSLWRGIREHMQPWEHGTTFTAFVNDRLQLA